MKNILLKIEYDGTAYCGWQKQDGQASVQQSLEEALTKVCGEDIALNGSGRTDAGVHAYAQMANFKTDCTIPPEKIAYAVNSILPDDIKVLESSLVHDDFHARFSAHRKTYVYKMYISEHLLPLKARTHMQILPPFDIKSVKKAARIFIGTHDFLAFTTSENTKTDTVRTIYSIKVKENNEEILIEITGNGFLHNMVRIIVGTLVSVGKGKIRPEQIKDIILSKNRSNAGITAPAHGLYLLKVEY